MWSLRFVLWPPSLLGCGGRLISKQLQLHTKNHMWSISCPLYKGNDIYIYTYICHICHICIELWNKFPKIWCTKFRKQKEKTIFRRLSRLQACFQIQFFLFGECHGYKPVSKIYDIGSSIHFCFSGFLLKWLKCIATALHCS